MCASCRSALVNWSMHPHRMKSDTSTCELTVNLPGLLKVFQVQLTPQWVSLRIGRQALQ